MKRIFLVLAALIVPLLFAGCSGLGGSIDASAAVQPGNIVFKDDFSNPKSGWETWNDPNGSMVAYQNDGLRFFVNEKQFDYWSRPGVRALDVRLEVDVIKLGGPNDNDFGMICRYQDRDNFYAFLASSDGYAGILKVQNGSYQILTGPQMKFSENIRQGEALNHLRADCNGSTLTLQVNGHPFLSAEDADFKAGEIGLLAGTGEKSGADVFFDNFWAYRP